MTAVNQITLAYKCPVCGEKIFIEGEEFRCVSKHIFHAEKEIVDLTPQNVSVPSIYDDPDYRKWINIASELLLQSYNRGSWFEKIQDRGHYFLESIVEQNDTWRLDLGCGFGRHFNFLKDKKRTIGFDSNLDSLKIASSNNSSSVFIKGRMEKLPFFDSSFGIVYAVYSLEHIYNLSEVLKEIKRILVRGGQLLVGLPAEGGLLYNGLRKVTIIPYFSKKYNIDYEKIVKIEHCNTASKVLRMLESEFKLEKIKYYPFGVRSIDVNLILAASFLNE